jgi:flavin-dependent dehydrogenase
MEHTEIQELMRDDNGITLKVIQDGMEKIIHCKLIVGAEGDRSIVAKKLAGFRKEEDHYCAGLRAYYKGVKDFHRQHFIELHFLKETLPGYLWLFPLPNGEANVGIGMLSSMVGQKKINLKKLLIASIATHPAFKERFSGAVQIGEIKGWGLPLGSKWRRISGNNFLLVGDAASLIDPFTGEGIGNGMLSGMIAAKQIQEAMMANRFDENFLRTYDNNIKEILWRELKISHMLQRLSRFRWLFNFVIRKASRNKRLRDTIMSMFENVEARNRLRNPFNYLKLLFR